jgi:hypothetical protein
MSSSSGPREEDEFVVPGWLAWGRERYQVHELVGGLDKQGEVFVVKLRETWHQPKAMAIR